MCGFQKYYVVYTYVYSIQVFIHAGAFTDGRLIVVITKMDDVYSNMDDEDANRLIKNDLVEEIKEITAIPSVKADIVMLVSSHWYNKSRKLAAATPVNEASLKDNVIRALFYSFKDVEVAGQDTVQLLAGLTSAQLVKRLEDASGFPALKQR